MPAKGLQNLTLIKGFKVKSGTTIKQFQLVKLSGDGEVEPCGLANNPIGVAQQTRIAQTGITDTVAVGMEGIATCIEDANAIARSAKLYTAASGHVSATQGTGAKFVGVAMEAGAAAAGGLLSVALDLERG